jgi:hypothetical protein
MPEGFRRFDSWSELIAWLELEGAVYYHAPLDYMPRRVRVDLKRETREDAPRVRVRPIAGRDFDAFIAGEEHLSRFLVDDQAPSSDANPPEPDTQDEARGSRLEEEEPDTQKEATGSRLQEEENHDFYGIPYSSDP